MKTVLQVIEFILTAIMAIYLALAILYRGYEAYQNRINGQ